MKKRSLIERLTGSVHEDEEKHLHPTVEDDTIEHGDLPDTDDEEGQLAVDVFQDDNEIVVRTMVAGVKPEDLDISITRDMVVIRGTRNENYSIEDEHYFHRELYWGTFSRSIVLPAEIEVEGAEASEKNGLLTIKLPKIDKNKSSKLKVRSN